MRISVARPKPTPCQSLCRPSLRIPVRSLAPGLQRESRVSHCDSGDRKLVASTMLHERPCAPDARLLPALAAAAIFVAACTLTRIALALRPEVGRAGCRRSDPRVCLRSRLRPGRRGLRCSRRSSSGSRSRRTASRARRIYRAASIAWFCVACFAVLRHRRRRVAVLGRIRRALQLHRGRLPAVHARGARQHLGVLPDRQAAGRAGAGGRRADRRCSRGASWRWSAAPRGWRVGLAPPLLAPGAAAGAAPFDSWTAT